MSRHWRRLSTAGVTTGMSSHAWIHLADICTNGLLSRTRFADSSLASQLSRLEQRPGPTHARRLET